MEDYIIDRPEADAEAVLGRAYAKEKRFILHGCGEILSADLYRSDDVVPTSVFDKTALPVTVNDAAAEIILPPHSLAQIRMK